MEKTIDEIYEEMLAVFAEASGYLPHSSCDLAARLYAAAAQLQGLYHQARWLLEQSFPQTAQGVYLEQHAQLRGLRRGVAAKAVGTLRFGVPSALRTDLPIAAGTVCMTAGGIRFETTEDTAVKAGSLYGDAPARALEPGRAGNVPAGAVTVMAAMPVGVKSCTNPQAFSGGGDGEDDEALRQRLLDTYRRLPNGANAAYYEQTALAFPGVAAAKAVGRPRGVGTVDLYVASAAGIPGAALLKQIGSYLQEKREISVDLKVLAPKTSPVTVNVAIQPAPGVDFSAAKADAEAALRGAFTGTLLGRGITLAYLGNLLYSLESVQNYRFTSPTADVAAADTTLPTLGTLTITEWGR